MTQPLLAASPLPNGGNWGLRPYRKVSLTAKDAVCNGEGAIYNLTVRNATTTPVYLNIYAQPSGSVTVGTTVPLKRYLIPAATSSPAQPGQLIITAGFFPILYCPGAITIAPVTSDSDSAASGGTLYVEMDYQGADQS